MTLEQLIKSGRFVYIVYTGNLYVVEVNKMHSAGTHTMNIRGEGETIEQAVKNLEAKLQTIEQP